METITPTEATQRLEAFINALQTNFRLISTGTPPELAGVAFADGKIAGQLRHLGKTHDFTAVPQGQALNVTIAVRENTFELAAAVDYTNTQMGANPRGTAIELLKQFAQKKGWVPLIQVDPKSEQGAMLKSPAGTLYAARHDRTLTHHELSSEAEIPDDDTRVWNDILSQNEYRHNPNLAVLRARNTLLKLKSQLTNYNGDLNIVELEFSKEMNRVRSISDVAFSDPKWGTKRVICLYLPWENPRENPVIIQGMSGVHGKNENGIICHAWRKAHNLGYEAERILELTCQKLGLMVPLRPHTEEEFDQQFTTVITTKGDFTVTFKDGKPELTSENAKDPAKFAAAFREVVAERYPEKIDFEAHTQALHQLMQGNPVALEGYEIRHNTLKAPTQVILRAKEETRKGNLAATEYLTSVGVVEGLLKERSKPLEVEKVS